MTGKVRQGLTPNYEVHPSTDLTGSHGQVNRTLTLSNQVVIRLNLVKINGVRQTPLTGYTWTGAVPEVITFLGKVYDADEIIVDYFM